MNREEHQRGNPGRLTVSFALFLMFLGYRSPKVGSDPAARSLDGGRDGVRWAADAVGAG